MAIAWGTFFYFALSLLYFYALGVGVEEEKGIVASFPLRGGTFGMNARGCKRERIARSISRL